MGRKRARVAAVSIVAATTLASVAYAQLATVQTTPSTDLAPQNTDVWLLVSVRNTGTTSIDISSIQRGTSMTIGCEGFDTAWTPLGATTLGPGEQAQWSLRAQGSATATCPYQITTGTGDTYDFNATLQVSTSAPAYAQVQPLVNDFGDVAIGSSADQYVYVENLETTPVSGWTASLSGGPFSFENGPTCTGSSCALSTIGSDQFQTLTVRCLPSVTGMQTATITVHAPSAAIGSDIMLACNGTNGGGMSMITVAPKPSLDIMTSAGMTGSASAMVNYIGASDTLVDATITGADASYFMFSDPNCTGMLDCMPLASIALPSGLGIACTPDSTPHSATLTVTGANGAADQDSTQLDCIPSAGGPHIMVTPLMVTAPTIPVGQSAGPYAITIQNTGGSTLTATATVMGTGATDWLADNCVSSTCSIFAGSAATIDVTFAPTAFGNRDAQLEIDSNDATPGDNPQIVNLYGSATGGVLAVTQPITGEIDFGTLPRNQLAQQPITAQNQGNASIMVSVAANAPFQTDTSGFSLIGGASQTFQAGCMSATPGSYDDYITLTGSGAYAGSPAQVHVTCTVAATDVQVTPTSFDFGEVRVHTAPVTKPVTITNPTTSTVHITSLALDATRADLSLTGGISSDTPLAPGGSVMASLVVTPDSEVDLAGVNLAIVVDGVPLSFPITGKVVTPHSSISPAKLDLGTACVGTAPSATEVLIDDGTATLQLQAPVVDQSFAATLDTPTAYPAALAPGAQAQISIHPTATAAAGALHGTLTWSDDVPNDYAVPVDLDYIAAGTALSPSMLAFGTVAVDGASPLQEITLQNCDPDPVMIAIVGIEATSGSADAWMVAPPIGYTKTVAAHEKLTINAQFAPRKAGTYSANLRLTANGVPLVVALTGTTPTHSLVTTDFYACSCDSHGAGGWPIALAIVVITLRRRRGSSSPR